MNPNTANPVIDVYPNSEQFRLKSMLSIQLALGQDLGVLPDLLTKRGQPEVHIGLGQA